MLHSGAWAGDWSWESEEETSSARVARQQHLKIYQRLIWWWMPQGTRGCAQGSPANSKPLSNKQFELQFRVQQTDKCLRLLSCLAPYMKSQILLWFHIYEFMYILTWIKFMYNWYMLNDFIAINSYHIFYYWIQKHKVMKLNSLIFSVRNSDSAVIIEKSYSFRTSTAKNLELVLPSHIFEFIYPRIHNS